MPLPKSETFVYNSAMADSQDSIYAGHDNRRANARIHLEAAVDLRSATNLFTGLTENISQGGVFIATEVHMDLGEKLQVSLSLLGDTPITVDTEVCWLRPSGSGGLETGVGVRFLNLTEKERRYLQTFIDSRIRDSILFDTDD